MIASRCRARREWADSLSLAFLVLLASLTPEQRAPFLLHDVFDHGYGEVAEIVGTSEGNGRQVASRARRRPHRRDAGPAPLPRRRLRGSKWASSTSTF
jgi:DNA-directed RNA polymerase specialized sigma24 family protein